MAISTTSRRGAKAAMERLVEILPECLDLWKKDADR